MPQAKQLTRLEHSFPPPSVQTLPWEQMGPVQSSSRLTQSSGPHTQITPPPSPPMINDLKQALGSLGPAAILEEPALPASNLGLTPDLASPASGG